MMLLKRSYDKEIIDDLSITDERLDRALYELKVINFSLGGNSVTRAGISAINRAYPFKNSPVILDLGSGGSDLFFKMSINGRKFDPVSADMNIQACRYTKIFYPGAKVVCCDAQRLPFKDNSVDVIHASLFFHHFKEEDMSAILRRCSSISRHGIVINDLRRSPLALLGIKILTQLFSRSLMVKNDGPLSVKRGFIKRDLITILSEINQCRFHIRRKWAFRWLIYCMKQ
ncbi:MAG: methyltransferase domain-containing protein [Acidobacteriota bacterium]